MKLEITLKDENIQSIITELYAKGCTEVAKAIEVEYVRKGNKEEDEKLIIAYLNKFGLENASFYKAYRFTDKSTNEDLVFYEIWGRNACDELVVLVTREPLILSNGAIYGSKQALNWIMHSYAEAIKHGAIEV